MNTTGADTSKSAARASRYSNYTMMFRVTLFLAHAISAMVMLAKLFGKLDGDNCKAQTFPTSNQVVLGDSYLLTTNTSVYPLNMQRLNRNLSCQTSPWGVDAAWCRARTLPDAYDYFYDPDAHVFGASWNTIAAVTVFEWITAGYALYYVDPFDSWMPYWPLWWGYHPVVAVCTTWNFIMLVILWSSRTTINVPPNNLFLFMANLVSAIGVQNFLARNRAAVDVEADMENNDASAPPAGDGKTESAFSTGVRWKTDHFLRQRGKRVDARYTWIGVESNPDGYQQANYNAVLDDRGFGCMPRYFEYAATAPLLLVALFATAVRFDMAWKYQAMWVALHVCNLVGIPLHYSILQYVETKIDRFHKVAVYLFIASWGALGGGLFLFIYTLRDIILRPTADTGMPEWVLGLIWLLLIIYSMFGVVASRFYVPRLWFDPSTTKYDPDDWDTFSYYLDVCSLVIKLPVAWCIWVKGSVVLCDAVAGSVC